jgi:hypothetical protein
MRWDIMEKEKTTRGFDITNFIDRYGEKCSLQKSSLATEDCIWLGIDDPKPLIMASKIIEGGTGWAKYPLPDDVHVTSRMHLTQNQVKELLPFLTKFAETGEL